MRKPPPSCHQWSHNIFPVLLYSQLLLSCARGIVIYIPFRSSILVLDLKPGKENYSETSSIITTPKVAPYDHTKSIPE
jgi:hypothetical protein